TFAKGVGNWVSALNATVGLARGFAPAPFRNSLGVVAVADGTIEAVVGSGFGAVVPLLSYTVSLKVRAGTTGRTGSAALDWYDATGAFLGNITSGPFTDSTGAWTTVTFSGTAPAGASKAILAVGWVGALAGEQHFIAAVSADTTVS